MSQEYGGGYNNYFNIGLVKTLTEFNLDNYIGIAKYTGDIYQGDRSHGVRVESSILLPYRFIGEGFDPESFDKDFGSLPFYIFKEDFFDPITRIKRGCFYAAESEDEWYLQDNKRNDLEKIQCRGGFAQRERLTTYQKDPLNQLRQAVHYPDVALGKEPFLSIWKIISIETSITGVPIVTLKSHRSFGELPSLNEGVINIDVLPALKTALDKLENSINRLSPTDVVDRCRDALSVVFGDLCGNREKDLGKAIEGYVKQQDKQLENMISWAGRLVNRFHPRGKPNEQFKKGLRPPSEEDAQLSVRCVWLVLVELGWATA
ncbi:hypothetical protein ACFSJY_02620 [Thalassotalea euphylliae]|uniref:hypothetical protein n=1 Tax=Thalassotalea euphylliae TaxID=1655234 RepID=UPI003625F453